MSEFLISWKHQGQGKDFKGQGDSLGIPHPKQQRMTENDKAKEYVHNPKPLYQYKTNRGVESEGLCNRRLYKTAITNEI